jgi:AraC-like DNA-binding protein
MTARAKPRRREWTPPVASSYAEYAPSDVLRPFVECFWTRETERTQTVASQPGVRRVLPDGCMDIILSFPAPAAEPESAMVVGTMTRALVLDASTAPPSYVGVRFRPARAAAFLSLPASEITNLRVSLDELWPDAEEVREALADGSSVRERVRAFDRVLTARLSPSAVADNQRDVDEAVRRIVVAGGSLGLTRLGPSLGVSRQHLARRFAQLVGVSPKVFARVVRLGRVVERVRAAAPGEHINWSMLALELGYYDQAHLIDEFREMTGVTPGAWVG